MLLENKSLAGSRSYFINQHNTGTVDHLQNRSRTPGTKSCGEPWIPTSSGRAHDDDERQMLNTLSFILSHYNKEDINNRLLNLLPELSHCIS